MRTTTIVTAFATALLVSMATHRAHSEFQRLDPTSALAQQAVKLALPELEARGLDKNQYTAEVYTHNSAVWVIFRNPTLLNEESEDDDDDLEPVLTLQVILSGDAKHVVDAYFAR